MLESPPPPTAPSAPATARALSSDQPGSPSGLTPFHFLGIAAAAVGLLSLIKSIVRAELFGKLRSGDYENADAAIANLNSIEHIFAPLIVTALATIAITLFVLVRRGQRGRAKHFSIAALVLTTLLVLLQTLFYLSFATKTPSLLAFLDDSLVVDLGITLLYVAAPIALLLFLSHGGHPKGVALAGLVAFIVVGVAAGAHVIAPPENAGPWRWVMVNAIPRVIGYLCIAFIAWSARFGSRTASSALPSDALSGEAWTPSHAGLQAYSSALVWRLVLTISGYGMMFLALSSRSIGLLKFMGWSLPLMALITGVLMTIGVFRYANQPAGSRGRPPATFAAVMMSIALLIDVVIFFAIVRVMSMSTSDYSALRDAAEAAEAAQSYAIWGMALSLAALLALIHSYREVARDLGDHDLAGSCVRVGTLVAAGAAGTFLARHWLAGAKRVDIDTLLLGGLGVLALLLVTLIAYLGLLGRVKDRLSHQVLGIAAPPSPLNVGGDATSARALTGNEIERWRKNDDGGWEAHKPSDDSSDSSPKSSDSD